MGFDWQQFLNSHHVAFQSSGPKTTKGNIACQCPWCGSEDPSMHLLISTEGKGYCCLRHPQRHKGRKAARLIQALIKCSYDAALDIAGEHTSLPKTFLSDLQSLLNDPRPNSEPKQQLKIPFEFRSCYDNEYSFKPYEKYLLRRGINPIESYEAIRYCTRGPYHHRIIFPVMFEQKLVGWTGRTIGDVLPRYKTLSNKPEKAAMEGYEPAIGPITDYLLFYDDAIRSGADTICICEGPFDALNLRMLGERNYGVTSVAIFGLGMGAAQRDLLSELLPNFRHKFLLLDQNTLAQSISSARTLSCLGVRIKTLPYGIKDPGELNASSFESVLGSLS